MALPTRKKIFNVVGESRTNPDGVRRQDILCDVEPGDPVELLREPGNTYDPNAIVVIIGGDVVGYIGREDASDLAPAIDAGRAHKAIVHSIRGGVPGYPSYGCQVSVAWDGSPPHPFVDLDDQQLRSRRSKRGARTRRLGGMRSRNVRAPSGCFGTGLLMLIGASAAMGGMLN